MAQKFNFNIPKPSLSQSDITTNPIIPNTSASTEIDTTTIINNSIKDNLENISSIKEKKNFEIKYILRSKIRENKKNHYPQEHVEKLKQSILHSGLQQNLTVSYIEDEDKYVLEAGHTRTKAIDSLIDDFKDYPEDSLDEQYLLFKKNVLDYKIHGYPCLVSSRIPEGMQYDYDEEQDLSEIPDEIIDSEIRLIATNEITRDRTPAMIAQNVARLDALYRRKNINAKSNADKINVNEAIAQDLNLSKTQIKKYKSIDKLIPELKEEFLNNNITLAEGSNYSSLTIEEQEAIVQCLKNGKKLSAEEIESLINEKKELNRTINQKQEQLVSANNEIEKLKKELIDSKQIQQAAEQEELLLEQENKIKNLQDEIEELKKKEHVITPTMSPLQTQGTKYDLSIKASFQRCKKELLTFLDEKNKLVEFLEENKDAEDLSGLSLSNTTDIEKMINELVSLIH